MNPMLIIAKQQFSDIIREPLVIVILLVLVILSFLNGSASMNLLPLADTGLLDGNDHFLSVSLSNTLYHTSFLLTMLSMFIGVFTIAEERIGGSIGVLLTKPLYRRDVVAGKFAGLALFLFLVTTVIVILCVASIMVFYGGPASFGEMVLRVSSYIIVLSLSCVLTLGVSFMIGIAFKNIFEILLFNGLFLFLDWRYTLPQALNGFRILIPAGLYTTIIDGVSQHYILETIIPYSVWLSAALPYIVFMLLAILAIFLFSCYLFNTQDNN